MNSMAMFSVCCGKPALEANGPFLPFQALNVLRKHPPTPVFRAEFLTRMVDNEWKCKVKWGNSDRNLLNF